MNPIFAQTHLPGAWDFVLYGLGAMVLIVLTVLVLNFGII